MQNRIMAGAGLIGAVALGALALEGCATEDYVNKHVAVVQGQVTDMQGQQQAQGARLDGLDKDTQEAMQRAEAAHKLAEGKFLYSMVLSDDSVKFTLSSSQLSPEAQTRLDDFVTKLTSDNRNVYVEIQGHTDSTGSDAGNLRLGEARAEAVRLFMNRKGVPLNRMATISYGDSSPVAPNSTRAGRAQNRRVVLVVMA
jgi:outer membrane protein OmpA-like peptidoglycan-associated protein